MKASYLLSWLEYIIYTQKYIKIKINREMLRCCHKTTMVILAISVDMKLQGYYKTSVLTWDYKVTIRHQYWHELQGYYKPSVLTWDYKVVIRHQCWRDYKVTIRHQCWHETDYKVTIRHQCWHELQGYYKPSVLTWDYKITIRHQCWHETTRLP